MDIKKIATVIPNDDFSLTVTFIDGFTKKVDIKPFIKDGISAALRNIEFFKNVRVMNGYITWENDFDFCPNFLYFYESSF